MNNIPLKERKFIKFLLNKYVITILFFVILFLTSPDNNIIYYFKIKNQYKEVEQKKNFILEEIKNDSIRNVELHENIKAKEKYGREKYMMKAPKEDIYVIKQQENKSSDANKE